MPAIGFDWIKGAILLRAVAIASGTLNAQLAIQTADVRTDAQGAWAQVNGLSTTAVTGTPANTNAAAMRRRHEATCSTEGAEAPRGQGATASGVQGGGAGASAPRKVCSRSGCTPAWRHGAGGTKLSALSRIGRAGLAPKGAVVWAAPLHWCSCGGCAGMGAGPEAQADRHRARRDIGRPSAGGRRGGVVTCSLEVQNASRRPPPK